MVGTLLYGRSSGSVWDHRSWLPHGLSLPVSPVPPYYPTPISTTAFLLSVPRFIPPLPPPSVPLLPPLFTFSHCLAHAVWAGSCNIWRTRWFTMFWFVVAVLLRCVRISPLPVVVCRDMVYSGIIGVVVLRDFTTPTPSRHTPYGC